MSILQHYVQVVSFLDCLEIIFAENKQPVSFFFQREKRLAPLNVPVDQEVESSHLKFLAQPPPGWNFVEAMARFNANVSYSGLVHAGKKV